MAIDSGVTASVYDGEFGGGGHTYYYVLSDSELKWRDSFYITSYSQFVKKSGGSVIFDSRVYKMRVEVSGQKSGKSRDTYMNFIQTDNFGVKCGCTAISIIQNDQFATRVSAIPVGNDSKIKWPNALPYIGFRINNIKAMHGAMVASVSWFYGPNANAGYLMNPSGSVAINNTIVGVGYILHFPLIGAFRVISVVPSNANLSGYILLSPIQNK